MSDVYEYIFFSVKCLKFHFYLIKKKGGNLLMQRGKERFIVYRERERKKKEDSW